MNVKNMAIAEEPIKPVLTSAAVSDVLTPVVQLDTIEIIGIVPLPFDELYN